MCEYIPIFVEGWGGFEKDHGFIGGGSTNIKNSEIINPYEGD